MNSIRPDQKIYLIAAVGRDGSIGLDDGRLPWHYPDDLRQFREKTIGHVVAMGRKTFDSIGRALPDRTVVVQSRDKTTFYADGRDAYSDVPLDFDSILAYAEMREQKLWIAGGATIYAAWLDWAAQHGVAVECHITLVPHSGGGSVKMPSLWER